MQNLFYYLVWLALLSVWGCTQAPPLRQDWRQDQGVAALLRLQEMNFAGLEDLRAEARITLVEAGKKQQATASVLYKRPDRLRLEVRGPLFSHIFTALLEGDSLTVFNSSIIYPKKSVHSSLLRDLTGIDLGRYDLRYAVLGLVEPGDVGPPIAVENPRADRGVFSLSSPKGPRQVWVDLLGGFFFRERLELEKGQPPIERHLGDYRQVAGIYLPGKVSFRQGEMAFSLEYKSYKINEGVADKLFIQGIPRRGSKGY